MIHALFSKAIEECRKANVTGINIHLRDGKAVTVVGIEGNLAVDTNAVILRSPTRITTFGIDDVISVEGVLPQY